MNRYNRQLIVAILIVALAWALSVTQTGWDHSISDRHGYRQTQTAITAYYMVRGGPFLKYETPVLGAPWSIPFEFPLYQWIVSTASKHFDTPLNQTGRLIGLLFFYLAALMGWCWLAELEIAPVFRLVFVTLMLVSPEYLFWSRTFMIESTALFFGFTYLVSVCRYARTRSGWMVVIGTACGALGALVKPTTLSGFMIVAALLYAQAEKRGHHAARRYAMPIACFVLAPILMGSVWTYWADHVKSLNPIASHLTSTELRVWNFGTFDQKFAKVTWGVLALRIIPDLVGHSAIPIVLIGALLMRRRFAQLLTCLVGFAAVFLIFTNLHVMHNYYTYANGIFLLAAFSLLVIDLLEQRDWRAKVGLALFVVIVGACVTGYYRRDYPRQKNEMWRFDELVRNIRQVTREDELIIVFGQDGSPELPYYSERRGLVWFSSLPQTMDNPEMTQAVKNLSALKVGALVICEDSRQNTHLIESAIAQFDLSRKAIFQDKWCRLYGGR